MAAACALPITMHRGFSAMKKGFVVLALLLTTASASLAKDICVSATADAVPFGKFVFRKVKSLKPGSAVNLAGIWFDYDNPTGIVPVTGTAVMKSDGTVRLGVQVFNGIHDATYNYSFNADTDGAFVGSGELQTVEPDNLSFILSTSFATLGLTALDCKTVVIP